LEVVIVFRAATALLAVAFVSGIVMMVIRFGSDRPSPPWMAKLHGFVAVGALALLVFGWAHLGFSSAASFALLALLLAAGAGLVLNLRYHWRHEPLPEGLVFAHMAVASLGFLVAGVVALSRAG
jgi:hypothetical protein